MIVVDITICQKVYKFLVVIFCIMLYPKEARKLSNSILVLDVLQNILDTIGTIFEDKLNRIVSQFQILFLNNSLANINSCHKMSSPLLSKPIFHYNLWHGIFTVSFSQQVHFTYDESSVTFQMPPPYSVVIQV